MADSLMARLARADLVDPAEVAVFHCINRCVRRCFRFARRQRTAPANYQQTGEHRLVESFPELVALVNSADATGVLIPYRNPPALIAYYLGVFSLSACIPLLGVVGVGSGIAAVVLGLKGLRRVKEQPQLHGTAHAWIGVIGGGIFAILGIVIQALMVIGFLSSR